MGRSFRCTRRKHTNHYTVAAAPLLMPIRMSMTHETKEVLTRLTASGAGNGVVTPGDVDVSYTFIGDHDTRDTRSRVLRKVATGSTSELTSEMSSDR